MNPLRLPPHNLLACPACEKPLDNAQLVNRFACLTCGVQFFDLAGIPCLFPNGKIQKQFWDSLLGNILERANNKQQQSLSFCQDLDLLPAVRARLTSEIEEDQQITEALFELLTAAGLKPEISPAFSEHNPAGMLLYFELLLRDWAWEQAGDLVESENEAAWCRLHQALRTTIGEDDLGACVVIGAGAGRLSWDLQRYLNPACTLALDHNPLLLSTAHRLIAQQGTWSLLERTAMRQQGLPRQRLWQLAAPPINIASAEKWFALVADAWHAPLKASSFDVLITPWFMDINGRDIRDLIGLVAKLLKPGGYWINTGPLLYGDNLDTRRHYTHDEILDLLVLAGFEVEYQNLESTPYLNSPLTAQTRTEQVWTFAARAPAANFLNVSTEFPPPWLQLPHLPIPKHIAEKPQDQPVLQHLLSLVDGATSLNQIAALMAPNLGPEEDAVSLIKTVFGQMIVANN